MTAYPPDEVLIVACKNCSRNFSSPIQMNRQSFASVTLENNQYQCPHCGALETYSKGDHHWGRPVQG
jgi:hypothetical protein